MKSKARTMQSKETAQTRSKNLLKRYTLNRSYKFIIRYIVLKILLYDDIVSMTCSRCIVNERFSLSESFVHLIYIA